MKPTLFSVLAATQLAFCLAAATLCAMSHTPFAMLLALVALLCDCRIAIDAADFHNTKELCQMLCSVFGSSACALLALCLASISALSTGLVLSVVGTVSVASGFCGVMAMVIEEEAFDNEH